MALHRDIFWIGRQWVVTGFGMQAVNQKHNGQFDIVIDRLWDDNLPDALHGQKWFNPDDFNKALAIARARHPQPPARPASPPLPVESLLQTSVAIAAPEPAVSPVIAVNAAITATEAARESVKPETPAPSFPRLRIRGHPAKLLRVWHVRRRH